MLYISKSTEIGNSPFALSGRLHTTTAPKLGQEPNDSLDGIKTLTLDRKEPVYIFPQVSDGFSDILIIEKRKRFLKTIRIPTCTQHLILAFKSKKCRKYAFYAGRESIISILKILNPYNTAQKSH